MAARPDLEAMLHGPVVGPLVWVLRKVYVIVFMGYCLVPFVLLSAHKWIEVFGSVYWMGHIFFLPWLFVGHLIVKYVRPPRPRAHVE